MKGYTRRGPGGKMIKVSGYSRGGGGVSFARSLKFTPDDIQDELSDRIEQGWSNDRIYRYYAEDMKDPAKLKRWLNSRRAKIRRYWDSFPRSSVWD